MEFTPFKQEYPYTFRPLHSILSRYINLFPNKPRFLHVCSTSLLKTLWEMEKVLIKSNFSFSHSVFYHLRELSFIFIKLKIVVCSTSLLKTVMEKEKLLVTSNFSFSHCVFYPFKELSFIFIKFKIVVCQLFRLGRV